MAEKLDYRQRRDQVYRWLRRCLIGPGQGAAAAAIGLDLNDIPPLDRYHTAILFPIVKGEDGIDPATDKLDDDLDEDTPTGPDIPSNTSPDALAQPRRRYTPPSSAGFSFFIRGADIRLQLIPRAVRYQTDSRRGIAGRFVRQVWRRIPLGADGSEARTIQPPTTADAPPWRQAVFDGRAELFVLWRPLADGWLVTVSLSNTSELLDVGDFHAWREARNQGALFEVELDCIVDAGEVGPYPRVHYSLLSDEEQELELQYRHHRIYAVGHGAAVDWQMTRERDNQIGRLAIEFLPRTEVPLASPDVAPGAGIGDVLDIGRLATIAAPDSDALFDALDGFVASYRDWVQGQTTQLDAADSFDDLERATGARITARMATAIGRMSDGVALLRSDPEAARAFGLANQAMRWQMSQADRSKGIPPRNYRWRPFQLAFLLLVIEPTVNEDSEFRDTLDLIWFPTGGGKTEAYLGLMAFLIAWRRLHFPTNGGGTTILMRYTLRLLTKDQFRRAARLICALELLRRDLPELGREAISLGIWVGQASSPNTYRQAAEAVANAAKQGGRAPAALVLEACPWCGAGFQAPHSYRATHSEFAFLCHNPDCAFGGDQPAPLPCNVVDEALYAAPPTLLIATIDKFARLAWEPQTSAFFGVAGHGGVGNCTGHCTGNRASDRRPPELIVQDELHLIASALGSIAGLYEAGLDTVLTCRGVRPKLIASTATIRMAHEQVQRLYGREAAIFPPPGLSADDSWFARTVPVEQQPGRLYLGYLAPALGAQHCLAPLAAALLSAPELLFGDDSDALPTVMDAWWTLLVYHGSLRGVGASRNALQDIDRYWLRYQDEVRETRNHSGGTPPGHWPRREQLALRVAQLTGNMTVDENADNFERLSLPQGDAEVLDLVLATNMISVGLDVSRLATMVINGQPLTTAEYIQASSRVGRAGVPGIVVANYFRAQARSLSHYESFRAYHESFYRFVEPTSVTPFTQQARNRALHAALVLAIRHANPRLNADDSAADFDPEDRLTATIIDSLKRRCRQADPERGDASAAHIDQLVAAWADAVAGARDRKEALVYRGRDRDRHHQRLLYSHDARVHGLWPTLNSMRNVENTALLMPR